jgi:predicted dehydrogenase
VAEQELGAAILGLGIGRAHLRAYQAVEGVRVVAVADINPTALKQVAEEHSIPFATTDYREAVDAPGVHLVSICTPDRLHAEQAIYCLQRGKHVLCEKPIAISPSQLAELRRTAAASGVVFAAGHNYRFVPQFAALREQAAQGVLGELFLVESSYIQDLWGMRSLGPDYWRFKDPQDLFIGGAVHNVDLLQWVAGEVAEVHAYANRVLDFWPTENNFTANLRFRNGCLGHVLLAVGAKRKRKFEVWLKAYGVEGSAEAEMHEPKLMLDRGDDPGDSPREIALEKADSHQREVAHFVACVRGKERPLVGIDEASKVMSVCFAVVRSVRSGKVEPVEYV